MINYNTSTQLNSNLVAYWTKKALTTFYPKAKYFLTDNENLASNYEENQISYNRKLPFFVSKLACNNTIFPHKDDNIKARVWHDCVHYSNNLDFSYESEIKVGLEQCQQLKLLKAPDCVIQAIYYDTIGQTEYFNKFDCFIDNQLQFVKNCLNAGKIILCKI